MRLTCIHVLTYYLHLLTGVAATVTGSAVLFGRYKNKHNFQFNDLDQMLFCIQHRPRIITNPCTDNKI